MKITDANRIVCQFSCGAASAVVTKLALARYGDRCIVLNAYVANEREDNRGFAADCEKWFWVKMIVLVSWWKKSMQHDVLPYKA